MPKRLKTENITSLRTRLTINLLSKCIENITLIHVFWYFDNVWRCCRRVQEIYDLSAFHIMFVYFKTQHNDFVYILSRKLEHFIVVSWKRFIRFHFIVRRSKTRKFIMFIRFSEENEAILTSQTFAKFIVIIFICFYKTPKISDTLISSEATGNTEGKWGWLGT